MDEEGKRCKFSDIIYRSRRGFDELCCFDWRNQLKEVARGGCRLGETERVCVCVCVHYGLNEGSRVWKKQEQRLYIIIFYFILGNTIHNYNI